MNQAVTQRKFRKRSIVKSLQFQLLAAALGLMVLLVIASWWLSQSVVSNTLEANSSVLAETGLRVQGNAVQAKLDEVRALAGSLAAAYNSGLRNVEATGRLGEQLLSNAAGLDASIVGLGLWPEPNQFTPQTERRAFQWLAERPGSITYRNDFNDPERISYFGELWYAIGRFAPRDQCFWSGVRDHLLLRKPVVTCTLPLWRENAFAGVVTVDMLPSGFDTVLEQALRQSDIADKSYTLLVDHADRVIAGGGNLSGLRVDPHPAIGSLSQRFPALGDVALKLFGNAEQRVSDSMSSNRFQATEISQLRDAARSLSRDDAERVLVAAWTSEARTRRTQDLPELEVPGDPALGRDALALIKTLPAPTWTLINVRTADAGLGGVASIVSHMLVMTVCFVLITSLLLLLLVQMRVLRPIRDMIVALKSAGSDDAAEVVLDERSSNEVGRLAAWLNDRNRRLREVADQGQVSNTRLALEVGERKNVRRQYEQLQDREAATLKALNEAVILVDADGVIEMLNPAAESLTGYSQAEALGQQIAELIRFRDANTGEAHPDPAREAMATLKRVRLEDGVALDGFREDTLPVTVAASAIRDQDAQVTGAVVVLSKCEDAPVTAERADGSAAPSAVSDFGRDRLTGLYSRATFNDDIDALLEQQALDGSDHTVALLDVDQMRAINDAHGEQAGTELLKHIGTVMTSIVGRAGRCYRFGADKFATVLNDANIKQADTLIATLRDELLDNPMRWEGKAIHASVSAGLASIDAAAGTAMELTKRTDDAVQKAKAAGGNVTRHYVSDNRDASRSNDTIWIERIKAGIANNMFHLMTQPIVGLQHGLDNGAEIHVSLEDEEGFWATPEAFMPAAVRGGLVADIDRLVLEEALKALSSQNAMESQLAFCAVNLAAGTLRDPSFLTDVFKLFDTYAVPPGRVCFEIDETVVVSNITEVRDMIKALGTSTGLGCKFTLDNFRSGVDGTKLLRQHAFDYVKLDGSLTDLATTTGVDRVPLEAVIRVLSELQMTIIAGKVDDELGQQALSDLGVHYAQGYGIARPTPIVFGLAAA